MLALALLGGAGTRLRPLTYDTPKPMLPIVERPMIARVLEWLALGGVTRTVFSLGYRPDAFVAAFPEGSWAGVEVVYAVEPEPLDTAGAIRFAALEAGMENERIIVVNGDVLTDLNLRALVAFHESRGGEATIALTPVEDPSAFGVVPTDDDGRVLAFIEKPPRGEAPTNLINAGSYVLEPSVIDRIPAARPVSVEREIFPAIVTDRALYAYASDAYWLDTGTPENYVQAQLDILRGARPQVLLPPCTAVAPGVYLAAGADVESSIIGCAFIGEGVVAQRDATIADAVIGASCRIESGAKITASVILPGACIKSGAVIDHSIVGAGAKIGKHAVLTSMTVVGTNAEVSDGALLDSVRLPV